jgi:undecaprenyl-diphosphatase
MSFSFHLIFIRLIHDLDKGIINFFNGHLSHSYEAFYDFQFISGDHLFKGGILMFILFYAWFKEGVGNVGNNRTLLLTTLFASMAAMGVSRGLTNFLPFNPRPLFDKSLHYFDFPISQFGFDKLSSFPSDHAVLFTALSTGIVMVNRRLGIIAMAYTIIFILFPRLYLGYHWPSDIFAGMIIGALITFVCLKLKFVTSLVERFSSSLMAKHPEIFYGLLFLLCYQIADMFDASRQLAGFLMHVVQLFVG